MIAGNSDGPVNTKSGLSKPVRASSASQEPEAVWGDDQWRQHIVLPASAEAADINRETWRNACAQIVRGHIKTVARSTLQGIYIRIHFHIESSLSNVVALPAARHLTVVLRTFHALLQARTSDGEDFCVALEQALVKPSVDLLLRCAQYSPSSSAHATIAVAATPPGRTNKTNPRWSPSPRRPSLQSLKSQASSIETDDGTEAVSDFFTASSAVLRDEAEIDRSRLAAACRSVRQNSLACLTALNETRPSQFFSTWPQIIGDGTREIPNGFILGSSSSQWNCFSQAATSTEPLFGIIQSDTALSVRLAACHLIENMLKKAREKGFFASGVVEHSTSQINGSAPAYTSLSARMGAMMAGLRSFIVRLLDSEENVGPTSSVQAQTRGILARSRHILPAQLLEGLLRLSKALIVATSNVRYRQPHADVLRGPALRLSTHTDAAVAIAACNVLSVVAKTATAASATRYRRCGVTSGGQLLIEEDLANQAAIDNIIIRLDDVALDPESVVQAWEALSTLLSNDPASFGEHREVLLEILRKHVSTSAQVQRQACQAFLATQLSLSLGSAQFGSCRTAFLEVLESGATDQSPLVRAETVQPLTAFLSLELEMTNIETAEHFASLSALQLLTKLIHDEQATVQAAAVRAVGVLLVSPHRNTQGKALCKCASRIVSYAIGHLAGCVENPALIVQLRLSWSVGNLCQILAESVTSEKAAAPDQERAILNESRWLSLLALTSSMIAQDERVRVNAVRGCGLLLSAARGEWLEAHASLATDSLSKTMEASHRAQNPKLRWNGANAVATAFSSGDLRSWTTRVFSPSSPAASLASRVYDCLSKELASKIFKVKLAAIQGMLQAKIVDEVGGQTMLKEVVLPRVLSAQRMIQGEINEASFREAQLHGEACKNGLHKLETHVNELIRSLE